MLDVRFYEGVFHYKIPSGGQSNYKTVRLMPGYLRVSPACTLTIIDRCTCGSG